MRYEHSDAMVHFLPETDDSLIHYGVRGMKPGVRRYQNKDGSLTPLGRQHYGIYERKDGTKDMERLKKDAKNDAEEYARAKAYYGEGAGTRRKKIKNRISERMKDPDYKREFEENLKQQNMAEHQKAADRERKWNDTKNTAAKTARGIKNILMGVGTASVAALGIVKLAQATGLDKKISEWGKIALSKISGLFGGGKSNSATYDYNPTGPSYGGGGGGRGNAMIEFLNRRH